MARPRYTKQFPLRLSEEMLSKINKISKSGDRSDFIRDAIQEKIDKNNPDHYNHYICDTHGSYGADSPLCDECKFMGTLK